MIQQEQTREPTYLMFYFKLPQQAKLLEHLDGGERHLFVVHQEVVKRKLA